MILMHLFHNLYNEERIYMRECYPNPIQFKTANISFFKITPKIRLNKLLIVIHTNIIRNIDLP